jgi:hypothetical protein
MLGEDDANHRCPRWGCTAREPWQPLMDARRCIILPPSYGATPLRGTPHKKGSTGFCCMQIE